MIKLFLQVRKPSLGLYMPNWNLLLVNFYSIFCIGLLLHYQNKFLDVNISNKFAGCFAVAGLQV